MTRNTFASMFSFARRPMLLSLLAMNIIVAIGALVEYPQLGMSNNIAYGLAYHLLCFSFLLAGYFTRIRLWRRGPDRGATANDLEMSYAISGFIWLLLVIGVLSSMATVTYVESIREYILSMISGSSPVTRGVEVRSELGGAPGYLKLLSFLPLAIYSIMVVRLRFRSYGDIPSREIYLFFFSILSIVVKVFFTQDRLSVFFLLFGILLVKKNASGLIRVACNLLVFSLIVIMSLISLIRFREIGSGAFDFVLIYSRLGLENLSIILQSKDYSWGAQSIFSAPRAVLEKLNIFSGAQIVTEYVWNPAQYVYSYLYSDFGYFSLFIIYFYGLWMRNLDLSITRSAGWIVQTLILPMSVNNFTGIGVMWLRGVEFFFVIFVSGFLLKNIYSRFMLVSRGHGKVRTLHLRSPT